MQAKMTNSNQNPTDLPALIQLICERANAEGLHMRGMGDYAREVKAQPGMTMTQAIIAHSADRLGPVADCLILQTDPEGEPRAVYVVGAETAESTRIGLTEAEYEQVLEVFKRTPIPLSIMSLTLGPDGSFGGTRLHTLDPSAAEDGDAK